jgi:hypothetical protein
MRGEVIPLIGYNANTAAEGNPAPDAFGGEFVRQIRLSSMSWPNLAGGAGQLQSALSVAQPARPHRRLR